jgi:hypothetical protein
MPGFLRNLVRMLRERDGTDMLFLCRQLLSERGEASQTALAQEIITAYESMAAPQRRAFFDLLEREFSSDEAANASTTATLSFTPISAGAVSGSLSLVSNCPYSPLAIPVTGTGVAQTLQLSASPASLSFGSITDGTTASQSVTLSNTGNANVSLSQISVSGTAFTATGLALPLTLSPGLTAQFSVTFAPTTSGALSATATVTSNASNSPTSVSLSGTGAASASHSVSLNWSPSGSSYNGFNIYRGSTAGGPYTRVNSSIVSTASYTDSSVPSGSTFYYVATEVGTVGVESSYSNEASAIIP